MIDGRSVKITPFRTANVPPPMSLHNITVDGNVIDVAFNNDASLIAVLYCAGIVIFKSQKRKASPVTLGKVASLQLDASSNYHQIGFSGSDLFVLERDGTSSAVHRWELDNETKVLKLAQTALSDTHSGTESRVAPSKSGFDASRIALLGTIHHQDSQHVLAQDHSGRLFDLTSNQVIASGFASFLPHFEALQVQETLFCLGQSRNGHLYCGSKLLAKNCTSFVATSTHLILTTTNHFLKFVHLTDGYGK